MTEELKGKVVLAEELNKIIFETTLTSEQKILIIALRLHEGALGLRELPKAAGGVSLERARRGLNRRKMCLPNNGGKEVRLLPTAYPKLAAISKGKKNVRKDPAPAASEKPKTVVDADKAGRADPS